MTLWAMSGRPRLRAWAANVSSTPGSLVCCALVVAISMANSSA